MALVGIILAVLVGIGFMIALPSFFGETAGFVGEAFILFVQKLFLLLAVALPLIICVIVFYIAVQKEKMEIMIYGTIYAMLLYLLTLYTGLYNYVSNLFYASMTGFSVSWYDALKPVKEFVVATVFFIVGVFNRFIEESKKFIENIKTAWNKAKKKNTKRR